jgi:sugar phosphate isomerase/epimerase
MKRREFIQQTTLAATGALLFPSMALAPKRKIGLQLYSLRDIINTDVKGTLTKIAAFGYKELEAYGYTEGKLFGMKSKEFTGMAKSMGMTVTSGHYGLNALTSGGERAVSDAKESGLKFMAVAYLTEEERKDYKRTCEALNKAGEMCAKYGIRLNYHNHDFEFQKFEGEVAYHVMLKQLDPKLVGMEMDLYWMYVANQNPLDYFAKYPGRFEQWHVKDMDKTDRTRNADVGTGTIDFKPLFAKAKLAGLKHFYVEQETYPVSSIESVEKSIKNASLWM